MNRYVSKSLAVVKNSPGYVASWAKNHPVQAAVAATAGSAALQVGLGAAGVSDAYPSARFVPYISQSLACAEANKRRVRNEKGRDLTFAERMSSSFYGAVAPMILQEGWEQVGATGPVNSFLKAAGYSDARQDFPGKGSFIDLGLTVASVMAIEAGKEGIQYLLRRKNNQRGVENEPQRC